MMTGLSSLQAMKTYGCHKSCRPLRHYFCIAFAIAALGCAAHAQAVSSATDSGKLKPILDYISNAWDTLTRSMTECQSVGDPKVATAPVLYLPAGFAEPPAVQSLTTSCKVRVEHLPIEIHRLGE